eukprot:1851429-Pyramimonas_sp.AAC.1
MKSADNNATHNNATDKLGVRQAHARELMSARANASGRPLLFHFLRRPRQLSRLSSPSHLSRAACGG